jgi:ATP-dependent DNA helicase RecG
MSSGFPVTLNTPIVELYRFGIPRFGQGMSRKLGLALASLAAKTDATEATVEDLLNYLPMRYEDRSNLAGIRDLSDGVEASLELYVRVAGGFQVGKNRGPKAPKLYIFEVTASDPERTGKPVVVWWFVSGRQAQRIIAYHRQKFTRGARFIAFGQWEWDTRRNTFALRLNKPDELEMLPGTWTPPEHALLRLAEENGGESANAESEIQANGEAEDEETAAGDEGLDDDESNADPALAAKSCTRS